MKQIPLTQGKFALVDDANFEALNAYKWYAVRGPRVWYARRNTPDGVRKQKIITMHSAVLGLKPDERADHRDADGLNNQRHNLRRCTKSQNGGNRRKAAGCSSQFKGVGWHRATEKWAASIQLVGKPRRHLGLFSTESKAARVYDTAATECYGAFARLNFP